MWIYLLFVSIAILGYGLYKAYLLLADLVDALRYLADTYHVAAIKVDKIAACMHNLPYGFRKEFEEACKKKSSPCSMKKKNPQEK